MNPRRTRRIPHLLALAAAAILAAPAAAQTSGQPPAPPAPQRLEVYDSGVVEEQPRLLNRVEMNREIARHYPRGLRRRRVGGTVVLRFAIRRDGTADPERIAVQSATNAAFVDAAAKVVPRMRFSPATLDGIPVTVWVTLPVTFAMEAPRRRAAADSASAPGEKAPASAPNPPR